LALRFRHLDRPAIRRLAAGQKITEHGITAERLVDGDIRWSVNIMVDGQRIHRVIGRESEGVTRTQADEFIEKARSDAREGRLSLPPGRKTHLAFSDAADKYLKQLEETGGKNMTAKERQLKLYLKPFFKSQRLDSISSFTVDRYKRQRVEAGSSNGTVNLELATLSHLFSKAIEWGWLKARPCKIKPLEKSVGRIIALSEEQERELLKAAGADADPYCWLFVAFGLNTAMRHGEILRARLDQIDFEHHRLFIPQAKAGTREQPITPELAEILKREKEMAKDQAGWIFPSPRAGASLSGHRDRMDKPFRRAVIAAGLDPKLVTPHVMRHTAITNLVKAGVDLPTIQRISGHKTLAMVMRYTHVHGDHIDRAIRAIGRAIPEPTANRSADTSTQRLHMHTRGTTATKLSVVKKS
jgi:integrase